VCLGFGRVATLSFLLRRQALDEWFEDTGFNEHRLRAQQSWPVLANTLMGEYRRHAAIGVGKHDVGRFPPSSSEMRLISLEASSMIRLGLPK